MDIKKGKVKTKERHRQNASLLYRREKTRRARTIIVLLQLGKEFSFLFFYLLDYLLYVNRASAEALPVQSSASAATTLLSTPIFSHDPFTLLCQKFGFPDFSFRNRYAIIDFA